MAKTSDAQKRASRAWEQRNKEKVRTHASLEDLAELKELIEERERQLEKCHTMKP